jgi:selenocysteine-specific elongation factor
MAARAASQSTRFVILGTAGHIDHGKTALVRLLTGTDTDRLPEEKARGISIDLGFAHLTLPSGVSCGVVDVPGHERFVKNMLAGACGVDAMLLVVAADEGIMPQTREHLDILDLLGVRRGLVALTKIDMVDEEWLGLVTESVGEYLGERGFGHFPIVPVSAKTGEGKDAVLAALDQVISDLEERSSAAAARLPVDRAFVVEGFGTVVTGTLWRGELRVGDHVAIEPGARATRIRNLEVHGASVPVAHAGQRTAVALAGVEKDWVPRGTWILAPKTLVPSYMLDARLRVLADTEKPLVQRQRVRFHLGASELLGRVAILEGDELGPGQTGLVQLRLESPAVADRGDRFVLRSYSPARAIAGGVVLVAQAEKRRHRDAHQLDDLRRHESGTLPERFLAALHHFPLGGALAEVSKRAGLSPDEGPALAAELEREVRALGDGLLISEQAFEELGSRLETILVSTQEASPLKWGLGKGELKSRLSPQMSSSLFEALLGDLSAAGRVTLRGDRVRLGAALATLPPDLQAGVERIASLLERGGKTPPSLRELEEQTGLPVFQILDHLTFESRVVKVTPDFYISRKHFEELLGWITQSLETGAALSLGDLREAWGMSRKFSVPFLEHLDREGWTRRVGDVRSKGRRYSSEGNARGQE